ncbi:MAG: hypothetical protein EAZ15_06130 [Sphingobacteriales bacterium]|nr:MAG: hypothetical protein EAZ15_06130 [Sphingobacteriales bacterium]
MKKTILMLLILVGTLPIYAQLDRRTWLVGGSGSFTSTSNMLTYTNIEYYEKSKIIQITLSPTIGYFVLDKLAMGLKPAITWYGGETRYNVNIGSGNSYTGNLLLGPFVRYYFLKKEKPYNFLLESSYQIGIIKQFDNKKRDINNLSLLAGTVIYFNPSVGLEFLLGYKRSYYNGGRETLLIDNEPEFFTNIQKGLQFNIGLQFHLEKK